MHRRLLMLSVVFGLLFVSGLVWFVFTANARAGSGSTPGPSSLFDSDQDGFTDAREAELGTNPREADSDFDGLTDKQELETYFTKPLNFDSDGDGFKDGVEVLGGYNPLGPN